MMSIPEGIGAKGHEARAEALANSGPSLSWSIFTQHPELVFFRVGVRE